MAGLRPYQDAEKIRQRRSRFIEILNVPHRGYASGFESPAALLDGLFEHPVGRSSVVPGLWATIVLPQPAIAEESKEGRVAPCLSRDGKFLSQFCQLPLVYRSGDGRPQLFSFDRLDEIVHDALPEEGGRHISIREAG